MKVQPLYITGAIFGGILLLGIIALAIYLSFGMESGANPGGIIGFVAVIWTSAKAKLLNFGSFPKITNSISGQTSQTESFATIEKDLRHKIKEQKSEISSFKKASDAKEKARILRRKTSKGTAILKENQYVGAYTVGTHRKGKSNSHRALVQIGEVTVYRDTDRDEFLDYDSHTDSGLFGINIHRASLNIEDNYKVNGWSAGCQVFAREVEWNEFLGICDKFKKMYKQNYTYTLLNVEDIIEAVGEMDTKV